VPQKPGNQYIHRVPITRVYNKKVHREGKRSRIEAGIVRGSGSHYIGSIGISSSIASITRLLKKVGDRLVPKQKNIGGGQVHWNQHKSKFYMRYRSKIKSYNPL